MEREYALAVTEFYEYYNKLREVVHCRMNSHFCEYSDDYLEVWQYEGEKKKKLLFRINTQKKDNQSVAETYRRATEAVKQLLKEVG